MHVMLDLETWGLEPGCAIRSIGAVVFDPRSSSTGLEPTFYRNVTDESNRSARLTADPKTQAWWNEQSDAARAPLLVNQITLRQAMVDFTKWWLASGAVTVWSHGANFDEPIFRYAAKRVGFDVPWHYREVRDTRTLFWLTGFNEKSVQLLLGGVEHNALDDALQQVVAVQQAMKGLRPFERHRNR
jgi:hypothetical protein